jgi:hypothetical protein
VVNKRVALALSVTGAAIGACQVLAGIEDRTFTVVDASAPPPDAGEAGGEAEAALPDPCEHSGPPPRPQIPFDETNYKYIVAIRSADFSGGDGAGHALGFDLDGVCTCDKRPGTAHGGASSCAAPSGSSVCDFDGGVDNAVFTPFQSITKFTPNVNGDLIGNQLMCGRQTLLIYIAGYNGKADDDLVSVGLVPSWGIQEPQEAGVPDADCYLTGSPEERAQPPYPARWDGTDRWSTFPNSVARGSGNVVPNGIVFDAYVAGYRLVVPTDPTRTMTFFLGGSTITVAEPLVVADLVGIDGQGNDVDGGAPGGATNFRIAGGVLAGRVAAQQFLDGVGLLKKGSGDLLCQDPVLTLAAIKVVCPARDITSDPLRDIQTQPDGAPYGCDAVSVAIRFSAVPAQIGEDYAPDAASDAMCPDAWAVCP